MPLHVIRGSLRVLSKSLPRNLQKIEFEQLRPDCDCADKYVQGTVVTSEPLNKLGNGTTFFKIVLEESENSNSGSRTISTVVFGKLAEECAKVIHQEDLMVVTGFSLAKSPSEDNRHCCQLEMSDEAGSTVYIWARSPRTVSTSAVLSMPIAPKYTYTPLNELQGGTVVNVYAAVKFFKPPFISRGTDYCSVITITDQSNTKLLCTLFHTNRDALPQIYKTGDIVRFHRIKKTFRKRFVESYLYELCHEESFLFPVGPTQYPITEYYNQLQGKNGYGFSTLTFDGTVGTPVVPRTLSKLFTFTDEDKKIVEDFRIWAATNLSNSPPAAKLSDVQAPMYFELICQLIGKAKVDGASYLLKVWDGTKCPFPSWKVLVKDDDLEGDHILICQLKNLTVDIMVYDNHVELAKSLKVGSFVRIYNLHAKLEGLKEKPDVSCIQFNLHSGTCYGRGITVLTEDHKDAKQLKQFLDSVALGEEDCSATAPEFEDSTYIILGSSLERCQQLSVTVLTDLQHFDVTALSTVINSRTPQPYRIRAKLRKYEPEKLHQAVKLHCPQCKLLQEIPVESEIDSVIRKASATCSSSDLQSTSFCEFALWKIENQEQRHVVAHFVKHNDLLQQPEGSLIMIEGGNLTEILTLTKTFKGVIAVRSTEDDLVLLDLSAPYFWQGNMRYYGCKHCSDPKAMISLSSLAEQDDPSWDATAIAEALGVVPLQYVFVMKFTLDDGTGSLDVYIKDSKDFFQIPASEVLINSMFQESIERIMNKLCPVGKDLGDLPWLECIIKSYYVSDGTEKQLCYQIFDTTIAEDV